MRGIAAILSGLLLLSGCGPEAGNTSEIHASLEKRYTSLGDLRADSKAVVQVTAGSARSDRLNDIPITVTDVRVDGVLAGAVASSGLAIQQFGGEGTVSPNTSQLLVGGRHYVLFVEPFQLTPGVDTDRFVITGDQGAYELRDGQYVLIGAAATALPQRVDPALLRKLSQPS